MNALSHQDCLAAASKRREDMNLSYSGAFLPSEAYTILSADAQAVLVDVRTVPELLYVGRVASSVHIEWQVFPEMTINQHFCDLLAQSLTSLNMPDTATVIAGLVLTQISKAMNNKMNDKPMGFVGE